MPLRELPTVLAEHVRDVRVYGRLPSERGEHGQLFRRVGDVVVTADHVRHAVDPVVDRVREVVRRPPVGADEHPVLELLCREHDAAFDRVLPGDHALVWHAQPDRAVVLVCRPLVDQSPGLCQCPVRPVELEARQPVPLDPEPAQRALDLRRRLGDLARGVRVLDPEQALTTVAAREEPVEEERPDAADVEEPRRRGGHADADAHRSWMLVAAGPDTAEAHT